MIQALSRQESGTDLLPEIERCAHNYITTMYTQVRCRGKVNTIELFKQLNLLAKAIATNNEFEPLRWRKSDKEGIPDLLKDLVPFLRGNPSNQRIALTITRSYELLHTEPKLDLGPIIDPGLPVDPIFQEEFKLFLLQ